MNPLYYGWIRRHRGPTETRRPAPWRGDPPVSDALWAQVEAIRRAKTRGGGPKQTSRIDLLGGLLECVCGRRLRSDGRFSDGRHRSDHRMVLGQAIHRATRAAAWRELPPDSARQQASMEGLAVEDSSYLSSASDRLVDCSGTVAHWLTIELLVSGPEALAEHSYRGR